MLMVYDIIGERKLVTQRTRTDIKTRTPIIGRNPFKTPSPTKTSSKSSTKSKTEFQPTVTTTSRGGVIEQLSPTLTVYRLSEVEQSEREAELEAQRRTIRRAGQTSTLTPTTEAQLATGQLKIKQRTESGELIDVTNQLLASGTSLVTPQVGKAIQEQQKEQQAIRRRRLGGARVFEKAGEIQSGSVIVSSSQPIRLKTEKSVPILGKEITSQLIPLEKPLTRKEAEAIKSGKISEPGLITPKIARALSEVKIEPIVYPKETGRLRVSEPIAFMGEGEGIPESALIYQERPEIKEKKLSLAQRESLITEGIVFSAPKKQEAIVDIRKAESPIIKLIQSTKRIPLGREEFEKESEKIQERQIAFAQSEGIQRVDTLSKIIGAGLRAGIKNPLSRDILTEYRKEREFGESNYSRVDTLIGGYAKTAFSLPFIAETSGRKTLLVTRGVMGEALKTKDVFKGIFGIGEAPNIPEGTDFLRTTRAKIFGRVGIGAVEGTSPLDPKFKRIFDLRYPEGQTTFLSAGIGAFFLAGSIQLAKTAPIKTPKEAELKVVNPEAFREVLLKQTKKISDVSITKAGTKITTKGGDIFLNVVRQPKSPRLIYEVGKAKGGVGISRITDPLTGKSTTILTQGTKITKVISQPTAQTPKLISSIKLQRQPIISRQTSLGLTGKGIEGLKFAPITRTKIQFPFKIARELIVKPQKITGTTQTFTLGTVIKFRGYRPRLETELFPGKIKTFQTKGIIELSNQRSILGQTKQYSVYRSPSKTRLLQQQRDRALLQDIFRYKIGRKIQEARRISEIERTITQETRPLSPFMLKIGRTERVGGVTKTFIDFSIKRKPVLEVGEYKIPKDIYEFTAPKTLVTDKGIGTVQYFRIFKEGKIRTTAPPQATQGVPFYFGRTTARGEIGFPAVFKITQRINISEIGKAKFILPKTRTAPIQRISPKISSDIGKTIKTLDFKPSSKAITETGKTRPQPAYFARDRGFGSRLQSQTITEQQALLQGARPIIKVQQLNQSFQPLKIVPQFKFSPIISPVVKTGALTALSVSISSVLSQSLLNTQKKIKTTIQPPILNVQNLSQIKFPTIFQPISTVTPVTKVSQAQAQAQTIQSIAPTQTAQTQTTRGVSPTSIFNLPVSPLPPQPPIPENPVFPTFDLGDLSEAFGQKKKGKKTARPFKFKPTLKSIFLNIRGKVPTGQLTGLEERPLPIRGIL